MLVEHLYRSNKRYDHESFEFDEIYNFICGDDAKFKGKYENGIYLTTKYYREFLANNSNATKDEISAEKRKYFHAMIPTGTFSGTCHAKEIVSLSGLIILDFDHLNNLEETREKLKNCINTFCCFTSPSRTGLKCLIKHTLPLDKVVSDWKYLYKEIREFYLNITEVSPESIDDSGSDVSRLCYLPYCTSKDIYRNNKCWKWDYKGIFKQYNDDDEYEIEYTEVEITEEDYLIWFDYGVFIAEHSINVAETYTDWRDLGYSLASIGELGREIYHNISCISDKYNKKKCDEQFDIWLNTFQENRTTILKYVNVAKKAINEYLTDKYVC